MMRRLGVVVFALLSLAGLAYAERPRSLVIPQGNDLEINLGAAPYNTIFLNRCASGCTIRFGSSNSINDTWRTDPGVLTPFPYGDEVWNDVVACVEDVFSPYVVNVTDVDPGSANHFEIMIAGHPNDIGMSSGIGGVAPGGAECNTYIHNALVFDFAKVWGSGTNCGPSCVEEICSTAAQEIGHAWGMDHVTDNKDPMTYFAYQGRRYFQKTPSTCGSDCVQGESPFGQTCTGPNQQEHICVPCGGATQTSHEVVKALFGLGPGTPPTVTITSPKPGANVQPGFPVAVDPVDDSGLITLVELRIDGELVSMLSKGPFAFNAPTTLADGTHRVEVTAYDGHQTPGKAMVDVYIGAPCEKPADCSNNTDTCVGGRCVPGSGVQGGLGQPCTGNTECASGQCATDGTNRYCVETCAVGDCPDGFGCSVNEGEMMGVCWPGYDDGSGGGCGCQSSGGGPLSMFVLFGWVVFACTRRRVRS